MMYRWLIMLVCSSFLGLGTFAQTSGDTTGIARSPQRNDTAKRSITTVPVNLDSLVKTPFVTPKKAALFSAILPGLGQYYNKQYWKIGVIYAGVGTAAYFVNDNLKNYNKFRRWYAGYLNNDAKIIAEAGPYSQTNAKDAMDYYRRNLDLTVLFTALGYTLQVMDAVVFAHLKNFDISEDITLRARPVLMPQGGIGFGLVMNFK
jgi:hypothetical protein